MVRIRYGGWHMSGGKCPTFELPGYRVVTRELTPSSVTIRRPAVTD